MGNFAGLLTTQQASKILQCTRANVCQLVWRGKLEPAYKVPGPNGTYLFTREVVEACKAARAARAAHFMPREVKASA